MTPSMDEQLRAALARHRAGDLAAAMAQYRELLARNPACAEAMHMLGLAHHQTGDPAQALDWFGRALQASPDAPEILANRAAVYMALDQAQAAEQDARAALALARENFGAWFNLGLALERQAREGEATGALRTASGLRPQHAGALLHWFRVAARAGQPAGVADRVRSPLPRLAGLRALALEAAEVVEIAGVSSAALRLLLQLRSELPNDAALAARLDVEMRYLRACELEYLRRSDEAMRVAAEVSARAPRHRGARLLRAELARERGEIEAALGEYDELLRIHPQDSIAASSRLIALQHLPSMDAKTLLDEHRSWGERYAPPHSPSAGASDPDPERQLRVGWLSPRFSAGVVETFFAAEFQALDRQGMRHFLYDNGSVEDAVNGRFRAAADVVRRIEALDDVQLCEQIRADRIDVLVELSGHGPGNRLRALALRPAPVQISWLDYFHGSGVEAIDFLLTDEHLSPPESAGSEVGRLLYLPSGRLCYAPTASTVAPAGSRDADTLRFACFNRLAKINDVVLALWARLLRGLPGSCLRLKASAFDDGQMRARFLKRCASLGIEADRLELSDYGTHAEALAAYADVDVALDPHPFSGCATSCDALAMGVPVVTWCGETMASRQTFSLLKTLGLSDGIAFGADEYVHRAQALAENAARRRELRETLPARVRSELGDVPRHARELGAALREAWRRRCTAGKP